MPNLEKSVSNDELADIIDLEGLDYAILHYLTPSTITDNQTRFLWLNAKKALEDLLNYLGIDS